MVLETVRNISFLSTILELYIYTFLLRMTDNMSSWDTLYVHIDYRHTKYLLFVRQHGNIYREPV
jgi:hypothetical protein